MNFSVKKHNFKKYYELYLTCQNKYSGPFYQENFKHILKHFYWQRSFNQSRHLQQLFWSILETIFCKENGINAPSVFLISGATIKKKILTLYLSLYVPLFCWMYNSNTRENIKQSKIAIKSLHRLLY